MFAKTSLICHGLYSYADSRLRKCGRVVCSSCSPHRITIPYQFIVQPPADPAAPGIPSPHRHAPTQSSLSTSDVASLGGGERVRLCNPCVPDPNVAPPQTPRYQTNLQSPLPRVHNRSTSLASSSPSSFVPPTTHDEGDRHSSRHIGLALPQYGFGENPASYQSMQSQARRSTISATGSSAGSHLQSSASSIGQNRDNGLSRAVSGQHCFPYRIFFSRHAEGHTMNFTNHRNRREVVVSSRLFNN